MTVKPQLAEDAVLSKVIFPCGVQPKIDGVRALNLNRTLTGRSLDPFAGFGITERFSGIEYLGYDGEMTLGNDPKCRERLCSLTTGAMGRFKGVTEMADLHWWLFDLVTSETIRLPYEARYGRLMKRYSMHGDEHLHMVPLSIAHSVEELESTNAAFLDQGYEGTIIRNLSAPYKSGRATQKGQELWRIKPWGDFEILVTGFTEGQTNTNEKTTNSLGRSERSSAKAGQVPNGQVGSIQGTMVKDFHDPVTGRLLFAKGMPITAGSGEMSEKEATEFFKRPEKLVGHIAKIKTMTHGVKDLPRFPTYVSHRLAVDMS
jgi:DNA ligase-1